MILVPYHSYTEKKNNLGKQTIELRCNVNFNP